jgi:ectoine hydroxylase-related dioxygenase (phytanoyl-CoA dioxygenase family)
MTSTKDWHGSIASECQLSSEAARQLRENGFVIIPGPVVPNHFPRLSAAYDDAVARADSADVHCGKCGASTRINDFVNRGPEFDAIYLHPPLLAACCQIIGGPFKLSGMRARTLNPGAPAQGLHVDVRHRGDGWPLVGCILMVDAFDSRNGATRFVPGTHRKPDEPQDVMNNPQDAHPDEILACGPAGSMIIFNASVWHGYGANLTAAPRRSIQAHFVPRGAQASPDDHARRMRPETLRRLGERAKYVLGIGLE